jgi:hypothetical protein
MPCGHFGDGKDLPGLYSDKKQSFLLMKHFLFLLENVSVKPTCQRKLAKGVQWAR